VRGDRRLPELLGDDWTVRDADRVEEGECDRLARRLLSETARPCWSTRSKAGAGMFSALGVPSIAWATIGSAFGSNEADAIGAAPRITIAAAPRQASERKA